MIITPHKWKHFKLLYIIRYQMLFGKPPVDIRLMLKCCHLLISIAWKHLKSLYDIILLKITSLICRHKAVLSYLNVVTSIFLSYTQCGYMENWWVLISWSQKFLIIEINEWPDNEVQHSAKLSCRQITKWINKWHWFIFEKYISDDLSIFADLT